MVATPFVSCIYFPQFLERFFSYVQSVRPELVNSSAVRAQPFDDVREIWCRTSTSFDAELRDSNSQTPSVDAVCTLH